MVSLSESLVRLSAAAEKLNKSTEELTASIESLEERLAGMGIGTETWLGVCIRDPQGMREKVSDGPSASKWRVHGFDMGYCKIGSSWRIAVKKIESTIKITSGEGNIEDAIFEEVDRLALSEPFALVNASRVVRALAIVRFDELISSLTKRVEWVQRRVGDGNVFWAESLSLEQVAKQAFK